MTFIPAPDKVGFADTLALDASQRLRVSNPSSLFSSKHIWDKDLIEWSEVLGGSGAASTFVTDQASINLSVSNLTAGSVIRQSRKKFNYQTGKSQSLLLTTNIDGLVSNVTKRVGAFENNNGLFFEFDSQAKVVIRSKTSGTPVDTVITQANWNKDTMDGTGPSGITIDWSKIQILGIDYQWLGAGRVRFFISVGGTDYVVHDFSQANTSTLVYMSTPNLPVRFEIINDGSGAATTLKQICVSVITGGGEDVVDQRQTIHTSESGLTYSAGIHNLIFGIRLSTDRLDATVKMGSFFTDTGAVNDFNLMRIILNGTIAGSPVWDTSSYDEVDVLIGTPDVHTVSGGRELISFPSSDGSEGGQESFPRDIQLTHDVNGVPDELLFTVTAGNAATILASLNWGVAT